MVQADPYGGQYVTAGDPQVDVMGHGIENHRSADPTGVQRYYDTYGTLAPIVWAEDQNRVYLASGQAIITPGGIISLQAALQAVQAHGYKGPTDAASVAQAYALLMSPMPSPPTAPGSPISIPSLGGTVTLPIIGPVPTLAAAALFIGGAYVLLGHGGRR